MLYVLYIVYHIYILKTELRISDFHHFRWLARHRLSVLTPTEPNMVKECLSNKEGYKRFCSPEKTWITKAVLNWNKINMEKLFTWLSIT